jgi:hypothetical protein
METKHKHALNAINSSFDLLRSKAIEGLDKHLENANRLVLIYRYVLSPLSHIAWGSRANKYRIKWQAITDRYAYAILLGLAGLTLEAAATLRFIMDITYERLWSSISYRHESSFREISSVIEYERHQYQGAYKHLSLIIHQGRNVGFEELANLGVKSGDFASSIFLLSNMFSFHQLSEREEVIRYSKITDLELVQRVLDILHKRLRCENLKRGDGQPGAVASRPPPPPLQGGGHRMSKLSTSPRKF